MGYTLQQLQQMGAKPISAPSQPQGQNPLVGALNGISSGFSALGLKSPDQMFKNQTSYTPEQLQQMNAQPNPGFLDRFSSGINNIYGAYKDMPVLKQAGQVVGGAVGALGGLEGGIVGAIGAPISNLAKGKPIFDNYGQQILGQAQRSAQFGYQTGAEAAPASSLGAFGKVPNTLMALNSVYQGGKTIANAKTPEEYVQGGLQLGTGAYGAYNAVSPNRQGMILDKNAKQLVIDQFPATKPILAPLESAREALQGTAVDFITKTNERTLNLNKKQLDLQNNKNLDIARRLAEEDIRLETKNNKGNFDSAISKLEDKVDTLAQGRQGMLQAADDFSGKQFSLDELQQTAINKLQNNPSFKGQAKPLNSAIADVQSEIAALKDTLAKDPRASIDPATGDLMVKPSLLAEIQSGQWKRAYGMQSSIAGEAGSREGAFQMGHSARDMMNSAFGDNTPITAVNNEMSNLSTMIDILGKRNNTPVQGGRLGRYVGGTIGSTLDIGGGLLGKLIGYKAGTLFTDFLMDPSISVNAINKVIGGTKPQSVTPELLQRLNQSIYDMTAQYFKADSNAPKMLPAPQTIQLSPADFQSRLEMYRQQLQQSNQSADQIIRDAGTYQNTLGGPDSIQFDTSRK